MGKLRERLHDATRSGVYGVRRDEELRDALKGAELAASRIDLGKPVFEAFAQALAFPAWFGGNWDALEDCLTDLSWRRGTGEVLLLEGFERLSDKERALLCEVLAAAAQFWAEKGRPFFAVFIDPARRLPLPPLFRQP